MASKRCGALRGLSSRISFPGVGAAWADTLLLWHYPRPRDWRAGGSVLGGLSRVADVHIQSERQPAPKPRYHASQERHRSSPSHHASTSSSVYRTPTRSAGTISRSSVMRLPPTPAGRARPAARWRRSRASLLSLPFRLFLPVPPPAVIVPRLAPLAERLALGRGQLRLPLPTRSLGR